jgi:hypothetical protein
LVFKGVNRLAAGDCMFLLGSKVIAYRAASPELLASLADVLPRAGAGLDQNQVINIDTCFDDLEQAVIAISDCLMAQFRDYLWIDAAVLVAPNGSTLMLCGASEAGKSTLGAALSYHYWKMLCEDVAIILADGTIPPLVRPISLRPGTAELIRQQTGIVIDAVDDRWLFKPDAFLETSLRVPLSAVALLKGAGTEANGDISVSKATPEQMVRELLPCSNALRINNGIDVLLQSLKDSDCWLLAGGTISQRMQALEELVSR